AEPFYESEPQGAVPGAWDLSPDGETIAKATRPETALTLVNVRDGAVRSLALQPPLSAQYVAFVDAKRLLVTGYLEGAATLAIADADGRVTRLASVDGWIAMPAIAADGRSIAVTERIEDDDVWIVEPQ